MREMSAQGALDVAVEKIHFDGAHSHRDIGPKSSRQLFNGTFDW